MRQLLTGSPDRDGVIVVEGADYLHLARARRVRLGDILSLALPGGETRRARIIAIDERRLRLQLCDEDEPPAALPCGEPKIILFQGLAKGARMDTIVRGAAEMGIPEIVPFTSAFSVPKIEGNEKVKRWERIIKEAREQSGSAVVTKLAPVRTLPEALRYWADIREREGEAAAPGTAASGTAGILFYEVFSLPDCIANDELFLHRHLAGDLRTVVVAVGAEGGFSADEAAQFRAAGFACATMGRNILRAETASLYALASCLSITREKSLWTLKTTT